MSGGQRTLGESLTTAEELAEQQQQASIAEFFSKNKQMLGFDSPSKSLVTVVKEAVDNGLDAAEEAEILPEINVEIAETDTDDYRVTVTDNGPGVVQRQIPKVFGRLLYGSRFNTRVQARGQQGIGISACVLYGQLTTGKPATITSKTEGAEVAHRVELTIDEDKNKPEMASEEEIDWDHPHGTRFTVDIEADMRARKQLHQYIRRTAVVNPHARVTFDEPALDEPLEFERTDTHIPEKPTPIDPHPHGVELGEVQKMAENTDSYSLSGFLQEDFTRVGQQTAERILDDFRDRYFGREAAWQSPAEHDAVAEAVREAVAQKKDAEETAFAETIAERVVDASTLSHTEVKTIVAEAAESVENEFRTRFGGTVREKTTAAVWDVVVESQKETLYGWLDAETTKRKDDAAVRRLANQISYQFYSIDGRQRATRKEVQSFVDGGAESAEDETNERFGETAREKITERIWSEMRTVDTDVPKVRKATSDRAILKHLVGAMRETKVMAPPTNCLSPIGADKIKTSLRSVFGGGEFYTAETRDADVDRGDPFIVEAGLAYGAEIFDDRDGPSNGQANLLRFANRVPLVYQRGGCATSDVVTSVNWRRYFKGSGNGLNQTGGSGMPTGPLVILIHVASTNVPFTSESKDAVANSEKIEAEIERAIRETARELKDHLSEKQKLKKRRQKRDVLGRVLPDMVDKLTSVTGRERPDTDAVVARIMNNVFLRREQHNGETEAIITNHSGRNASFEMVEYLEEDVPDPADLPDEVDIVEDGAGHELRRSVTVEDGEQRRLRRAGPAGKIQVKEITDERVTVKN